MYGWTLGSLFHKSSIEEKEPLPYHANTPAAASSPPHLDWVTGLRGLISVLVVIFHLFWHFDPDAPMTVFAPANEDGAGSTSLLQMPIFRFFIAGGSAHVGIFFILSSIVCSLKPLYLIRCNEVKKLKRSLLLSALARPIRLFIPTASASMFIFILAEMGSFRYHPERFPGPDISWHDSKLIVFSAAVLETWGPGYPSFDPNQWMLKLELLTSYVVYAYLLVTRSLNSAQRTALAMFAIIPLSISGLWWMCTSFIGLVLCEYILSRPTSYEPLGLFYICIGLFVGGFPEFFPERAMWSSALYRLGILLGFSAIPKTQVRYWGTIGATCIIVGVIHSDRTKSFLKLPWNVYIGRISFPVYLLHGPLMKSLLPWVQHGMRSNGISSTASFTIALAVYVAVLLALSELATRTIEVWSVRLSKQFSLVLLSLGN